MFSSLYRYLMSRVIGKKSWQYFFQVLHNTALSGMNYGNGGDFRQSGEEHCAEYVKHKLTYEKTALSPIIVFDVGANTGHYSKLLCNKFPKNTIIHSFEPSGNTFGRLLENNAQSSKIKAHNVGMGSKEATLRLFSNATGSALASLYDRRLNHLDIDFDNYEDVSILTIDLFCQRNGIEKIDFLKLDVEGHELEVLHGAEKMIKEDKISFIQFEFGGANIDSRTFFQDFFYLLSSKYRIYRVLKDGLYPITEYDERLEVFNAINYLAESRDYAIMR